MLCSKKAATPRRQVNYLSLLVLSAFFPVLGLFALLLALLPFRETTAGKGTRRRLFTAAFAFGLALSGEEIGIALLLDDAAIKLINRVTFSLLLSCAAGSPGTVVGAVTVGRLGAGRRSRCSDSWRRNTWLGARNGTTGNGLERRIKITDRQHFHQPIGHGIAILGRRTFGEESRPTRFAVVSNLAADSSGSGSCSACFLVGFFKVAHRIANKTLLHIGFQFGVVRVGTLRGEGVRFRGFFAARHDLRRNTLFDRDIVFRARVFASNNLSTVLVALAEVALGNRDFAVRAVAELDSGVAAGKVRTNELFSVFDILRDYKVRGLS